VSLLFTLVAGYFTSDEHTVGILILLLGYFKSQLKGGEERGFGAEPIDLERSLDLTRDVIFFVIKHDHDAMN